MPSDSEARASASGTFRTAVGSPRTASISKKTRANRRVGRNPPATQRHVARDRRGVKPSIVPDSARHGMAAGVSRASPKILLINLVAVDGASWVKISS